jgi:hypothetical protein
MLFLCPFMGFGIDSVENSLHFGSVSHNACLRTGFFAEVMFGIDYFLETGCFAFFVRHP